MKFSWRSDHISEIWAKLWKTALCLGMLYNPRYESRSGWLSKSTSIRFVALFTDGSQAKLSRRSEQCFMWSWQARFSVRTWVGNCRKPEPFPQLFWLQQQYAVLIPANSYRLQGAFLEGRSGSFRVIRPVFWGRRLKKQVVNFLHCPQIFSSRTAPGSC